MTFENSELLKYMETHRCGIPYYNDYGLMAKTIMIELVKNERADFLLLRDEEVSKWWNDLVSYAAKSIEKDKKALEDYEIQMNAWNRLSEDDRKSLGLTRKPSKPKLSK
jgi:hypothetical protein